PRYTIPAGGSLSRADNRKGPSWDDLPGGNGLDMAATVTDHPASATRVAHRRRPIPSRRVGPAHHRTHTEGNSAMTVAGRDIEQATAQLQQTVAEVKKVI